MYSYRVTKYNPVFRNEKGTYQREEWTSFSDIGSVFGAVKLTPSEYSRVESLYISAIGSFMSLADIDSLKISGLEKKSYSLTENDQRYIELYPDRMTNLAESIQNNDSLSDDKLNDFCKLCLRNQLWARLENESKMFVHFGNDYYMYVGISNTSKMVIEQIRSTGLFVETFESPYLEVAEQ
jgi:hypothetical protein